MKQLFRNNEPLTTSPGVASKINYNNSTSGLEAGNVQEAIDKLNTKLSDIVKDSSNGMTIHQKLDVILGNANIDYNSIVIDQAKLAYSSLSGYDKTLTVTVDNMANYSHILILTSWVWTTEAGNTEPILMTIDEFRNAGEISDQYLEQSDSLFKVNYISDTSISIYRGTRSGVVILLIKSKNESYYEEYKVRVNDNFKTQSILADPTILSDNSGTLVSLTDNYLFTALKPCKVIIYHYGHTYDSKNTKVCIINDVTVNTTTDIATRFIQTLEIGDTMYLARTNSAGYYSENAAYLRFVPI